MRTITLTEKQEKELATLETKFNLEKIFTELTGITPSIISPESKPFAVFYPKTKDEYLLILNTLQPINENAQIKFASGNPIDTFSPYLITYGGKHDTPNYMEVCIKFPHAVCPIWVKLPADVQKEKFEVSTLRGEHTGFGNYETKYTLSAKQRTTIQVYYGENKTMYAANEEEAKKLKDIIFI